MRREKWCCFSDRSSNLLTIANCYLYCKTNNEDNEVLWGYFVVTTKLPHACRSYSSFWMIKIFKDGAKYATSTFPIMHLICPPKFCIHSKALKIWPFRWVKYSPIFESNLAPLNQGQYSPISQGWFGPRAEMGPTVGWNSLLIELFWPK